MEGTLARSHPHPLQALAVTSVVCMLSAEWGKTSHLLAHLIGCVTCQHGRVSEADSHRSRWTDYERVSSGAASWVVPGPTRSEQSISETPEQSPLNTE